MLDLLWGVTSMYQADCGRGSFRPRIRDALGLTLPQARRVASRLVAGGWLVAEGERKARRYRAANRI